MLDRYWHGEVERISPEAPVPVVRVTREEARLGGAANVALNVRALGAESELVSVIGGDDAGRELRAMLNDAGVAPALLCHEARTTVKLRVIGRSQQITRVDFEDAVDPHASAAVTAAAITAISMADAVIVSDYAKGCLCDARAIVRAARQYGKPVVIDPKGADWRQYFGASVVTPNRSEAEAALGAWVGDGDLARRAHQIRNELSIEAVLVTLSERGMILFDAEGTLHVPAEARQVYDVTGAGDTVVAVLGVLLAAGMNLREAVPIANRAAGIVVGRLGTSSVTAADLFGE